MVQHFLRWAKFVLLMSVVTFIGFLCWGIYCFTQSEKSIALDIHNVVLKISSVADNVNTIAISLKPKLDIAANNLDVATDNLDKATEGINITIAEINKPCSKNDAKDCGTLAYVEKTIKSVRLAVGQITAVSLKEQSQLQKINEQEVQVASDTHDNLVKLGDTLTSLNSTLTVQLPPLIEKLTIAAANFDSVTEDAKTEMHNIVHPSWPRKVVKGIVTVPGQVIVWLLTKI